MKSVVLVIVVLFAISIVCANQLDISLWVTSDDSQGQKLVEAFKNDLIKTGNFNIVTEDANGNFIFSIVTLDPYKDALLGIGENTYIVYNLNMLYRYNGFPVLVTNQVGFVQKDNIDTTAEEWVDDIYNRIGKFYIDHPEVRQSNK